MAERFSELNRPSQLLVLLIVGLALYALGASWVAEPGRLEGDLLVYGMLAALTGFPRILMPSRGSTVSVSSAVVLAAVMRFPAPQSLLVAGLAGLAGSLISQRSGKFQPLHRILFASSTLVLSAWGAGKGLEGAGGTPGPPMTVATLWPAAVATLVYFLLDSAIVATILGVSQRKRSRDLWKQGFLWMIPSFYAGASCGWVMNLLYEQIGGIGFAVVGPPLFIIYRAYRLHVDKLVAEKKSKSEG